MKIDNRKTFIKRLLSGTMSKEQRKIFIQLDEIDFQLRKQWDEAGNESIDWQMKVQIWRNIKNKLDNKNRTLFLRPPVWWFPNKHSGGGNYLFYCTDMYPNFKPLHSCRND